MRAGVVRAFLVRSSVLAVGSAWLGPCCCALGLQVQQQSPLQRLCWSSAWGPLLRRRLVSVASSSSTATTAAEDGAGADGGQQPSPFRRGDQVRVHINSFGPMGASVAVELDAEDPALEVNQASGLIVQTEIALFRAGRRGEDVYLGDDLPGWVLNVRADGKLDIGLRPPAAQRVQLAADAILTALRASPDGALDLGDKSPPDLIRRSFPGFSKSNFKDALGNLFRRGLIVPAPHNVRLSTEAEMAAMLAAEQAKQDARAAAGRTASDGIQRLKKRGIPNTVLVRGFPYSMSEDRLTRMLAKCGPVKAVTGMVEGTRATGRALVEFHTRGGSGQFGNSRFSGEAAFAAKFTGPERADGDGEEFDEDLAEPVVDPVEAALALDGTVFQERRLSVTIPTKGPSAKQRQTRGDRVTLYVGNLSFRASANDLKVEFESVCGAGAVQDIRISPRNDFAHIDLVNRDAANVAIETLDQFQLKGRRLRLDFVGEMSRLHMTQTPRNGGGGGNEVTTLFVGNLNYHASAFDLSKAFEGACGEGSVVNIRMSTRNEFAHLDMASREAAELAMAKLDQFDLKGRKIRLELSKPKRSAPHQGRREGAVFNKKRNSPPGGRHSSRGDDEGWSSFE